MEYRFPLPFMKNLGGAVFIDGAAVGERVLDPIGGGIATLANLVRGTGAITPGFGVRYYSSVGPIRVDLGFNPSRAGRSRRRHGAFARTARAAHPARDSAAVLAHGSGGPALGRILNRFTLHLSIGQAY